MSPAQCHPVRAQVYAPTFPGYGRSEKPALAYSQELWRDFLRDFVVEVRSRCGNCLRWRGGFVRNRQSLHFAVGVVVGAQLACVVT